MAHRNTRCGCSADPEKMAAYGVGIDDVQHAIEQGNTNLPAGRVEGANQAFTLKSNGQLVGGCGLPASDRGVPGGVPVRLDQVGDAIATMWRTTSPRAGGMARAASFWLSRSSRARTPWKWLHGFAI